MSNSNTELLPNDNKVPLLVQWHITSECSNRCKHCYMYDESTYQSEKENALSFPDLMKVLSSLEDFADKYGANLEHIAVSGGDPLLRKDWPQFIEELHKRVKSLSILGNPETLTKNNLRLLKELGVEHFQLSLDGLESTHDYIRSPGSFKRTVEKIDLLREYGISCGIMFTLTNLNAKELIPLVRFVANETNATHFAFDLGCNLGNASRKDTELDSSEVQDLLERYLAEKRRIENGGNSVRIVEKSRLLLLTHFEKNNFHPLIPTSTPVVFGCWAGWAPMTILSDGTALPCRRLPIKVGKMPDDSFEEIFLGSKLLRMFRRASFWKGCGTCDFYSFCRGCPAYVFGLTGDPFEKNPVCYRDKIPKATNETLSVSSEPAIDATFDEEWEFITSRYTPYSSSALKAYLDEKDFQLVYLDLAQNEKERVKFFTNPREYVSASGKLLTEEQMAMLILHFGSGRYQPSHFPLDTEGNRHDPFASYALFKLLESIS